MSSFGWLAAVAGCSEGRETISGEIELAAGVDAAAFRTLELRALPRSGSELDPAIAPEDEPPFSDSFAVADIEFPHAFLLAAHDDGDTPSRWLVAWLTNDTDAEWIGVGEPFGATPLRFCVCATHSPASADDVRVTIATD